MVTVVRKKIVLWTALRKISSISNQKSFKLSCKAKNFFSFTQEKLGLRLNSSNIQFCYNSVVYSSQSRPLKQMARYNQTAYHHDVQNWSENTD